MKNLIYVCLLFSFSLQGMHRSHAFTMSSKTLQSYHSKMLALVPSHIDNKKLYRSKHSQSMKSLSNALKNVHINEQRISREFSVHKVQQKISDPLLPALGAIGVAVAIAAWSWNNQEEELTIEGIPSDPEWIFKARLMLQEINSLSNSDTLSEEEIIILLMENAKFFIINSEKNKKQLYQLLTLIRSGYNEGKISKLELNTLYKKLCDRLYWNYRCSSGITIKIINQVITSFMHMYHYDFPESSETDLTNMVHGLCTIGINNYSITFLSHLFKCKPQAAVLLMNDLKKLHLLEIIDIIFKDKKIAELTQNSPFSSSELMQDLIERLKNPDLQNVCSYVNQLAQHPAYHEYEGQIIQALGIIQEYHGQCLECLDFFLNSRSLKIKEATHEAFLYAAQNKKVVPQLRLHYIDQLFAHDPKRYFKQRNQILKSLFFEYSDEIKMAVLKRLFESKSSYNDINFGYTLLASYAGLPPDSVEKYIKNNKYSLFIFNPSMMMEVPPSRTCIIKYIFDHCVNDSRRYELLHQGFIQKTLPRQDQETMYKKLFKDNQYGLDFRKFVYVEYLERIDFNVNKAHCGELSSNDPFKSFADAMYVVLDSSCALEKRIDGVRFIVKDGIGLNTVVKHFNQREKRILNKVTEEDQLIGAAFGLFKTHHTLLDSEKHWIHTKNGKERFRNLEKMGKTYTTFCKLMYLYEDEIHPELIDLIAYF